MIPDHYATLGVASTSPDAVIRTAYLELMRRHHPDRNPSAAAAARVGAITHAYSVLADQKRRSSYDDQRARLRARHASAVAADRPETRLGPWLAAAFGVVTIAFALPFLIPPPLVPPELPDRAANAKPGWATPAPVQMGPAPGSRAAVASIARAAAEQRPTDPSASELRRIRTLPDATPDPPASPQERPSDPTGAVQQIASPAPGAVPPAVRIEPQRAASRQGPSFSCHFARSQAQFSVCNSASLAALDRETASLYGRSLGEAEAPTRALLLKSDGRFLARRDNCASESCVHGAYVERIQEIEAITAGRQR